jgi:hypothetical protein
LHVSLPKPPTEEPEPAPVSKNVLRLLLVILIAFGLVALYANVQKLRRDKIETVTFTPASSPAESPSPRVP